MSHDFACLMSPNKDKTGRWLSRMLVVADGLCCGNVHCLLKIFTNKLECILKIDF